MTLWLPRGADSPQSQGQFCRQEALGWLAVRLLEAGGGYAAGVASFPSRASFPAVVLPMDTAPKKPALAALLDGAGPEALVSESLWVYAEDLKNARLQEILRRAE